MFGQYCLPWDGLVRPSGLGRLREETKTVGGYQRALGVEGGAQTASARCPVAPFPLQTGLSLLCGLLVFPLEQKPQQQRLLPEQRGVAHASVGLCNRVDV